MVVRDVHVPPSREVSVRASLCMWTRSRIEMGKSPKPYESPLSAQLAEEILNLPVVHDTDRPAPRTIGEMVQRSVDLILHTNEYLRHSTLAKIVARSIMQKLKKRGDAAIVVRFDGTVVLRVTYAGADEDQVSPRPRRDAPSVQMTNHSSLPYLDALRAEAAELGVDISHLGRQRKAIHEYLRTYRTQARGVDEVRVTPVEDNGQRISLLKKRAEPSSDP